MGYKIIFSISLILLFFQNCGSKVGFSQNGNGTVHSNGIDSVLSSGENLEPVDIGIINKACREQTSLSKTVKLDFPKPNQTCEWGVDGNLSPLNKYFRARIEQKRNLNLPVGAIICDATFVFKKQDYLYDDHFILSFNNSVIASSYDFSSTLKAGSFNLLQYDWNSIAGMYWNVSMEQIYCPQIPGDQARCSFPGHDQQGYIELSYDSAYMRAIMSNGIPENHYFKMISIGDNDNLDCEHSDVSFDVAIKYVIQ